MEVTDELIKQWEPKVQKIVSVSFVIGMDKEDLAQELRIAILKAAQGFDETRGISFHTYLHTTLINTLRTLISKAQRKYIPMSSIDEVNADTQTPSKKIMDAIANTEDFTNEFTLMDEIRACGLTENEALFLQLRLEGLTMDEISEDLGESAYVVRQSVRKKAGHLFSEEISEE